MQRLLETRTKFIHGDNVGASELNCVAADVFSDPDCPERREWARHIEALLISSESQKKGEPFAWPEVKIFAITWFPVAGGTPAVGKSTGANEKKRASGSNPVVDGPRPKKKRIEEDTSGYLLGRRNQESETENSYTPDRLDMDVEFENTAHDLTAPEPEGEREGKTYWVDPHFATVFRESTLPLALIQPWNFLVCTAMVNAPGGPVGPCQSNITVEEIYSHLKAHNILRFILPTLHTALNEAGILRTTSDPSSYIPHGIIAPIPHLPLEVGRQCDHPDCSTSPFVGSQALLDHHFAERHNGVPFNEVYMRHVHCQPFLHPTTGPSYFRVYPEMTRLDTRTDYAVFYRHLEARETWTRPRLRHPQSDSEVSPWLQRVGWHKVMENCDPIDAKSRINLEHAPEWLRSLQGHVAAYIQRVEAKLRMMSPVVRTWLRKDSDEEQNSVQIKARELTNYEKPWTALIQLLLLQFDSPLASFPVPMSPEVTVAVKELHTLLVNDSQSMYTMVGQGKGTYSQMRIHALVFALLSTRHRDLGNDQTACPVARFIVLDCLEIHREGCRFLPPHQCRVKLHPLEYVFRICLVEEASRKLSPGGDLSADIKSLLRHIRPIDEGDPITTWSVLSNTAQLATYLGKAMRKPNMFWSEDSQELVSMGIRAKLSMQQIRNYVLTLIAQAKSILRTDVMRNASMSAFSLFWANIASLPDNTTSGSGLITHILSNLPTHGDKLLLQTLMQHCPGVFHDRIAAAPGVNPISWRQAAIRKWFLDVERLLEYFCAALPFLVGPVTAASILKHTFGAQSQTAPNMVVCDGHLAFLSHDGKTTDPNARLHYLPDVLGHDVMFYLVYVRPLEIFWLRAVSKQPAVLSLHRFWVTDTKEWDTNRVYTLTEKLSFRHINLKISFGQWKDLLKAIIQEHLTVTQAPTGNRVEDLAAGHNSSLALHIYAVGHSYSSSSGAAQTAREQCAQLHKFWGVGAESGEPVGSLSDSILWQKRLISVAESFNTFFVA
ncbi:hypothetical protein C8F04DRAFT_1289066 [Mycena alexandri]|uniref:Uncharacterized protein n=1 Tax=Mycena alexandri TaxID=1745969 RepID=A0AAD6SKC2_9AGAR|nr:hypothetical protein C8F04DRAFT_1289066 [Mycena alexandri]